MRVVLIGDSITFGDNASGYSNSWAGRLEDYLKNNFKGKLEVINSSVQGETANEAWERIEDGVIKYTPDIVYIGYGTNDCAKEMGNYTNDFYNFESNVKDIAEAIRSQANAHIVFNLAPPVIEELCNDDVVNLHNVDIEAYNGVIKTLCANMTMSYIDHYKIMSGKGDLSRYIDADGIHPNDEGHRLMFETIIGSTGHLFR